MHCSWAPYSTCDAFATAADHEGVFVFTEIIQNHFLDPVGNPSKILNYDLFACLSFGNFEIWKVCNASANYGGDLFIYKGNYLKAIRTCEVGGVPSVPIQGGEGKGDGHGRGEGRGGGRRRKSCHCIPRKPKGKNRIQNQQKLPRSGKRWGANCLKVNFPQKIRRRTGSTCFLRNLTKFIIFNLVVECSSILTNKLF